MRTKNFLIDKKIIYATYFTHLSDLIGTPVFLDGKNIGVAADVYGTIEDVFPKLNGIIVKKRGSKICCCPLDSVSNIIPSKGIYTTNIENKSSEQDIFPNIMFCKTFWDKQIVDVYGAKVVRVNDLHLLQDNNNFWIVHIDIGLDGLLRRIGWHSWIKAMLGFFFAYTIPEKVISWRHVSVSHLNTSTASLHLNQKFANLSNLLPQDLAEILSELGTSERIQMLRSLKPDLLALALIELQYHLREQLVAELSDEVLCQVLELLSDDDATDIASTIKPERLSLIASKLSSERIRELEALITFPEDTAGALMTRKFLSCMVGTSVSEILNTIKSWPPALGEIEYVYVVDVDNKILGVISLRELLMQDVNYKINKSSATHVVSVGLDESVDDLVKLFIKYKFTAMPVVDNDDKIKGVISLPDVIEHVFAGAQREQRSPFS